MRLAALEVSAALLVLRAGVGVALELDVMLLEAGEALRDALTAFPMRRIAEPGLGRVNMEVLVGFVRKSCPGLFELLPKN